MEKAVRVATAKTEDMRLPAERLALAYLVARGYSCEAHRWMMGKHSLHLVMRRAELVVFVEVTRRPTGEGRVPLRRQKLVGRIAALWALRFGRRGDTYRFDHVNVQFHPSNRVNIEHLEDAWRL